MIVTGVATLRQSGYYVSPIRVDDDLIDILRVASDNAVRAVVMSPAENNYRHGDGDRGFGYVRRIENLWTLDPAFASLLVHRPIIETAEAAIGARAMPVNAQLIIKGARESGSLNWHFDPDPVGKPRPADDYVLAVYLEDSSSRNGAIQVVPGSHRWSFKRRIGWLREHPQIASDPAAEAVELSCPAGTICLHERGILHGSPPNRTDGQRRTIYVHYRSKEFLTETRGENYVAKLAASLAGLPALGSVR
ncbi:phytanoyl-CoA dioxygenase family protein [Nocardia sp. NPDC058658]|uniref:phytanoyl-CoA dioxygenase family protein n=1 Tax=Nocardia sp. NPDC058658 TaxID=3346580 RepID=UPI00365E4CEC